MSSRQCAVSSGQCADPPPLCALRTAHCALGVILLAAPFAAFPAFRVTQARDKTSAAAGLMAAISPSIFSEISLKAPEQGSIPVAFLISDGAVVIDFCGPWEVFQDVRIPGRSNPFHLYTVAKTTNPIRASAGMKIVPDYTFDNAPAPKVIVIPAQSGDGDATLNWLRTASRTADVTMSVCTGAFILAKTGLLNGKAATTHHAAFNDFAMTYANVQLKRGARYVDNGNIASAGGLSSGIDLAFHVVERYFGRDIAEKTAFQMEYQGEGWKKPDSNAVYAVQRVSTEANPLCAICQMDVDPATSPKSVFKGKTYYFCNTDHKALFDQAPEKWV
jgi:putative intracellular protease/amidase/YHS domain-containing protein